MNDKKKFGTKIRIFSQAEKKKQHSYKETTTTKRVCKTKHLYRECHSRLIFCLKSSKYAAIKTLSYCTLLTADRDTQVLGPS